MSFSRLERCLECIGSFSFPAHSRTQVLWASETVGLSWSIQSGWVAPAAEPDHDTSSQSWGAYPVATKDPPADPLWPAQRGRKGKRSYIQCKVRSNIYLQSEYWTVWLCEVSYSGRWLLLLCNETPLGLQWLSGDSITVVKHCFVLSFASSRW